MARPVNAAPCRSWGNHSNSEVKELVEAERQAPHHPGLGTLEKVPRNVSPPSTRSRPPQAHTPRNPLRAAHLCRKGYRQHPQLALLWQRSVLLPALKTDLFIGIFNRFYFDRGSAPLEIQKVCNGIKIVHVGYCLVNNPMPKNLI